MASWTVYHEEQDTQNVGGDRPSHSMSSVREWGETTANPEEMGSREGVGTGLLPGMTPGLLVTLDK